MISLARNFITPSSKYVLFPFYDDGNAVGCAPVCGMTLRSAGSMRFRWNEENPVRKDFFSRLLEEDAEGIAAPAEHTAPRKSSRHLVPLQLDHTHIVYDVNSPSDTEGRIGDGIITVNHALVPSITVADCVPVFLYDPVSGVFGIVHSGWKGTGIAADAIKLAAERHKSRPEDFLVLVGPHIHDCCYIVDQERAGFFAREFCEDCVTPLEEGAALPVNWKNRGGRLYRLSLARANVAALKKIGVQDSHITLSTDCTCCNPVFGSNRRETAAAGRPDSFTVQAAFIYF